MSYNQVRNDYFIYLFEARAFVKVEGTPVTIAGFDGDYFVHAATPETDTWMGFVVSDGLTGTRLTWAFPSPEKAISEAREKLIVHLRASSSVEELQEEAIKKIGLSPRWGR